MQALTYAVRIVNNTPRVLRGVLPGFATSNALEVPPQSSVDTFDIPAETATHLLERGAVASREGHTLVFEVVVDATP